MVLAGSNGGQASSEYSVLDRAMALGSAANVHDHASHSGATSVANGAQLYNTLSRGKEIAVAKKPTQPVTRKRRKRKLVCM